MRKIASRTVAVVAASCGLVLTSGAGAAAVDSRAGMLPAQPAVAATAGARSTLPDGAMAAVAGPGRVGPLTNQASPSAKDRPLAGVAVAVAGAAVARSASDEDAMASPGMLVAGFLVLGLIAMRRMGG